MKYLVLLTLIFSSQSYALDLYIDDSACVDRYSSMNVDVEVSDESFSFDFDCDWSDNDSFETERGVSCEIEAEMCDNGNDYGSIEVECDNGDWESEDFSCRD